MWRVLCGGSVWRVVCEDLCGGFYVGGLCGRVCEEGADEGGVCESNFLRGRRAEV